MFSSVVRKITKDSLIKASLGRNLVFAQVRCLGDVNKLADKGMAEEKLFFTKNDEKLLKDLIKKLHKQTDIVTPSETQTQLYKEQLRDILIDNGIDGEKHKDFIEELIIWKRQI
jgi:hypothetical protein